MLATIRDDTWNVLNTQHIIPNLKKWVCLDIPGVGHKAGFIVAQSLMKGVVHLASVL